MNSSAIDADVLVVGSGLAGLTCALTAAERLRTLRPGVEPRVIVVTKREPDASSTAWAQGGIAAVTAADDSFEQHTADTLTAGAGLCWSEAVRTTVEAGPARIRDLVARGVKFTRENDATEPGSATDIGADYDLGREGGHMRRRILHAGDITGRSMQAALLAAVAADPAIQLLARHHAVDLITTRKLGNYGVNECVGAYVLDTATGEVLTIRTRAVCLATGGAGKVYLYTSNPDVACGEGIALAFRAGAAVADMEFFQFHPTVLFHPDARTFLISEALRGEGGELRLLDGTPFMHGIHELGSLAPRDIVARAIDAEMKRTGDDHVVLDMTHLDAGFLKHRFPNIYAECRRFGIDMAQRPIPVVPAAHYCCGGVLTDLDGESEIRNLFAVGECASTGLHGANRLASNSLLECAVYGHRAAERIAARASRDARPPPEVPAWDPGSAVVPDEMVVVTQNWEELRRTMWNYVGIVRGDRRLTRARNRIELLKQEVTEFYWNFLVTAPLIELRNLLVVADLIVACARARRECRGLHYSIDCLTPANNDTEPCDTIVRRRFNDVEVTLIPVKSRARAHFPD